MQLPPEQTVAAALHELPAQHGCPDPPQAAQVALAQSEPFAQTFPQQGWVTMPHAAHIPLLPQIAPVLQVVPQHAWPTPPQGVHLLATQR